MNPEIQVSMPDVVKFVRQLAHDLRNDLNAAELQSAYLIEIAEAGEVKEEIKRLRGMISHVGANLQSLTVALGQPRLTEMPYSAKDFVDDLRQKLEADYQSESATVKWDVQVGETELQIDPQLLLPALLELFGNAFRHGRTEGAISVTARAENGRFIFSLREPKAKFERSTEDWGREPLRSVSQGHYGLGLHRTRGIIEAHGGELKARYEPDTAFLSTTVTLPGAAGAP
ncbi:MAG TPA: ATP-binding protein [Chthoniobacterales bacterium]|nr:ATP-binding protein [Chthoniobacterales bacterium]